MTTETEISEAPRRADAVRNRERVIKAAEEIFAEQGVEAGIPEIAERAGVGKGTVYRNFETKDDLVSAVLVTRAERFSEDTKKALESDDAWKAFRHLLHEAVRGKMQNGTYMIGMNPSTQSEALIAERARSQKLLGQLMNKAKKQGKMRKDAKPSDITVLFGGICRVLSEDRIEDPKVWKRYADQVVDSFRVQPS